MIGLADAPHAVQPRWNVAARRIGGEASGLWMKCRPDRTRRSRVRSTRENRWFSKWKKVRDDFFHGQLELMRAIDCPLASLTAVMDHFSRNFLSQKLSNTLTGDLCTSALDEALSRSRPEIFNTDQGAQFTATAHTSRLESHGVGLSMDGRSRALDNVFVERLWRSVKDQEDSLRGYANGWEAEKSLRKYFDSNRNERIREALGSRNPAKVYAGG